MPGKKIKSRVTGNDVKGFKDFTTALNKGSKKYKKDKPSGGPATTSSKRSEDVRENDKSPHRKNTVLGKGYHEAVSLGGKKAGDIYKKKIGQDRASGKLNATNKKGMVADRVGESVAQSNKPNIGVMKPKPKPGMKKK